METINNMAASAAKAVWGENNPGTEEPISGRTGDTSKGEPYDAGNMEPASANKVDYESNAHKTEPASSKDLGYQPSAHTTDPVRTDSSNLENNAHTTESSSADSAKYNNETTNSSSNDRANGDITKSAEFAKTTGTAELGKDTPDNPSTELKAKSGPEDSTMGQNDVRSPENPQTHPKSAPTDVNDSPEEGLNESQKLDGPGPKPVADVAKEHGGDAGNSSTSVDAESKKEEKEEKLDSNKATESSGTGEQYVKSSGLQADGGDFDATKPGAGAEADRLKEQKGIMKPTDSTSKVDDASASPTSKKSLGQKIKDKLHRHHE